MVSSSASAQKRPDQTETSPPTQMPVEGQPAAGEQAPAPTPTVVLDDTQPAPPPNPPNPDNPTETGPKTTRPAARTPKKAVELTDFQQMVVASLGKPLPIYGLSLFENVPTTFAPVDRVPVTADYVIGPGDELLIRAWGQIDLNVHTRVDRNGSIFLPKVGNLNVAGLKYAQVEEFLKSHIGRIYQNFDLNVTMGELRSIDVYRGGSSTASGPLYGQFLEHAGQCDLCFRRTVAHRLDASHPTETRLHGDHRFRSLRSAAQRRQEQRCPSVAGRRDLRELRSGRRLPWEDRSMCPPFMSSRETTDLTEALRLAGGLSTTASGGKVFVEHIEDRQMHSVEQVSLDAAGLAHPIKDGDVVNVTLVSPRFENSVTLRGNVAQPGRYPWHEGMRISDLIPNREFLITAEYWKQQNAVALQATGKQRPGQQYHQRGQTQCPRDQLGLCGGSAYEHARPFDPAVAL